MSRATGSAMAIAQFPGFVIDSADKAALALGASQHDEQPGSTFRVFLDPAGHPFCLCVS